MSTATKCGLTIPLDVAIIFQPHTFPLCGPNRERDDGEVGSERKKEDIYSGTFPKSLAGGLKDVVHGIIVLQVPLRRAKNR